MGIVSENLAPDGSRLRVDFGADDAHLLDAWFGRRVLIQTAYDGQPNGANIGVNVAPVRELEPAIGLLADSRVAAEWSYGGGIVRLYGGINPLVEQRESVG